ncbi:uncharacterized protein LJ264_008846 [Porphyrio hochstetteri]
MELGGGGGGVHRERYGGKARCGRGGEGGCAGDRAARRERAPPSRARVPVLHGAAQPALQRELESRSAPRSASHSAAHASAARRRPAGAGRAATAVAIAPRSGSDRTPREATGNGAEGDGAECRRVTESFCPTLPEGCFPALVSMPKVDLILEGGFVLRGGHPASVPAGTIPHPSAPTAEGVIWCFGSNTALPCWGLARRKAE